MIQPTFLDLINIKKTPITFNKNKPAYRFCYVSHCFAKRLSV